VDLYLEKLEECSKNIGHDGGEDFYLMTCLDAIGAGYMVDTTLLRDRYDFNAYPGALIVNSTADCGDGWAVAFHPHKNWEWWQKCWFKTQGAKNYVQQRALLN